MEWLPTVGLAWMTPTAHVVAGYAAAAAAAAMLGWVICEDGLTGLGDVGLILTNKPYVGRQTPDTDGVDTVARFL